EAFTPFLFGLAEPWAALLPRELEDRAGDFRTAESLVGCGPFLLDRHETGVKAVFTRNPGYHARPRPYLDRIEWLFIKERATQLSLFRAGQVDLPFQDGRLGRAEASDLHRAIPAYSIVYWDGLGGRRLALRADRAPLGDARVRRGGGGAAPQTRGGGGVPGGARRRGGRRRSPYTGSAGWPSCWAVTASRIPAPCRPRCASGSSRDARSATARAGWLTIPCWRGDCSTRPAWARGTAYAARWRRAA